MSGMLVCQHGDFDWSISGCSEWHVTTIPRQGARDATKQFDFKSVSRSYSLYENKALKLKLKWEKTQQGESGRTATGVAQENP